MLILLFAAALQEAEAIRAIPTFECMSLEWPYAGGREDRPCRVEFRPHRDGGAWTRALDLWFDAREGQYRGSVVGLKAGVEYEFRLSLEGGPGSSVVRATWPDRFPVSGTVTLPEGRTTEPLVIREGGTPAGWRLYRAHPGGSTIDVGNRADACIRIEADRVIVQGIVCAGARIHGIWVAGRKDVVIEGCDVSGWGRPDPTNDPRKRPDLGMQLDSGIFAEGPDVERLVIQGNRIHHPRHTSNDWSEWSPFFKSNHPQGPKAIVLKPQTRGNHVIRFNEVTSDDSHLYNDLLLESDPGWPGNGLGRDSDICGNLLTHGVDDAIEIERGTRNVRLWANYFDRAGMKTLSVRPCWEGPWYCFRNVVDRPYLPKGKTSYNGREVPAGMFIVGGGRGPAGAPSEPRERGLGYVFHNTLLCPEGAGFERFLVADFPQGLNKPERWFMSRNNLAPTRPVRAVPDTPINDFFTDRVVADFDLYSGIVDRAAAAGPGCVKGRPKFRPGHGSGPGGLYQLAEGSPGRAAGTPLPGFSEGKPDLGAHETGAPPMVFGVRGWIPAAR